MKYARVVIKKRRYAVLQLWLEGLTVEQITEEVNKLFLCKFGIATIFNDINWIKKESHLNVRDDSRINELFLQMMGRQEKVSKDAYSEYEEVRKELVKLRSELAKTKDKEERKAIYQEIGMATGRRTGALITLDKFEQRLFDNLTKVGVLKEAPKQIEQKSINIDVRLEEYQKLHELYEKARAIKPPNVGLDSED